MDLNEFTRLVLEWASARGILAEATAQTQFGKVREEVDELAEALRTLDVAVANNAPSDVVDRILADAKDAIGDIAVTLIIEAAMLGVSFEDCCRMAWDEIKDRKGRMVDGVFVKDV